MEEELLRCDSRGLPGSCRDVFSWQGQGLPEGGCAFLIPPQVSRPAQWPRPTAPVSSTLGRFEDQLDPPSDSLLTPSSGRGAGGLGSYKESCRWFSGHSQPLRRTEGR